MALFSQRHGQPDFRRYQHGSAHGTAVLYFAREPAGCGSGTPEQRKSGARNAGGGIPGTEDRSVLSYLVKPLRDQVARAFRER